MTTRKRGRPHKWHPQIIAGWRYAKGASIAETAKEWMISPDTVKRACRDHGEGALLSRQAWLDAKWVDLSDKLETLCTKHGGYRPVFLNLTHRMRLVEAAQRETERALEARGLTYTPSPITKRPERTARSVETASWDRAFGIDSMDDSGRDDAWELSTWQERELGW